MPCDFLLLLNLLLAYLSKKYLTWKNWRVGSFYGISWCKWSQTLYLGKRWGLQVLQEEEISCHTSVILTLYLAKYTYIVWNFMKYRSCIRCLKVHITHLKYIFERRKHSSMLSYVVLNWICCQNFECWFKGSIQAQVP